MEAIDRAKAILVQVDADSELRFRFLTVRDEEALRALVQQNSAPRGFALEVLVNQLREDSPRRPADLTDGALAQAAHSWADQDSSIGKPGQGGERSLEAFKQRIVSHVEVTERALLEFSQRVYPNIEHKLEELKRTAAAFSPAILQGIDQLVWPPKHVTRAIREALTIPAEQFAAIGRALHDDALRAAVLAVEEQGRLIRQLSAVTSHQMEAISAAVTLAIPSFDLVRSLPSAQEIVALWQQQTRAIEKGKSTLDREGFPFAKSLVGMDLAVALAGIPEKVHGVHAANRLLAFTRGAQFCASLEERLTASDVSRRRWPIVERAYAAHSSRAYLLSVPALFAQVEGLFTDSMVLNGLAEIRNGRVCALDAAGNLKLDRRRQPVVLTGLGAKTQHSPYQNHAVLSDVVGVLVQALTGKRNGVLHGSDTAYGRAKLSTQLMLLVLVLATEILAFERGETTP